MNNRIVSIIAPCYNEEENVEYFYKEIVRVFNLIEDFDFELIFADDASTDATVDILKKIRDYDKRIKIIVNSRNYGVYRNSFNALKYATGEATIPMLPVDLQDPPALIPVMLRHFEGGAEIVAGVRYDRDENFVMKGIRRLYYRWISRFADFEIPRYVGEYQLIDQKIIKKLRQIDDYYPYTRGLIAGLSNKRILVEYTWAKRKYGKSKNNLPKLIDQGINGIISTSTAPLRLLSVIGVFGSLLGLFFGAIQIVAKFSFSKSVTSPGVSTIILLLSLFLLYFSIAVGVISEYLAAIHSQVRGRWRVVESEILVE